MPLIPFSEGSILKAILSPFFSPAGFPLSSQTNLAIGYPPIPWLGIMLVGFASGKLFELPDAKRKIVFMTIDFWLCKYIVSKSNSLISFINI